MHSAPQTPAARRLLRPAHQRGPAFSFIIPVYDRVQVVYECLWSCLNQTVNDLEVVVVLDGSPPETREVVEHFRDDRLRVISYSDSFGRPARARNRGILEACGDWVCFLDSDDIASPCRLEAVRAVVDAAPEPPEVVYGGVRLLPCRSDLSTLFGRMGHLDPQTATLDALKCSNQIYMPTVSVRRHTLLKFGGFRLDLLFREDHELWLRLMSRGCRFAATEEVLALYRLHEDNLGRTLVGDDARHKEAALAAYQRPFKEWLP